MYHTDAPIIYMSYIYVKYIYVILSSLFCSLVHVYLIEPHDKRYGG